MSIVSEQQSQSISNPSRTEDLNPLISKWLIEWREQARQHGSKMEFVYAKALKSLRAHPESLSSGQECRKLKGFGEKICAQIDKKFAQHFNQNGTIPSKKNTNQKKSPTKNNQAAITEHFSVVIGKRPQMFQTPKQNSASISNSNSHSPSPCPPARKVTKTTNRRYIPAPNSTPFAILIALLRLEIEFSNSRVNKLDLQKMTELYLNTPITWQSMKTLITKKLVDKTDERNVRYFLTDDGRKLAKSLAMACPKLQDFSNRFLLNPNVNTESSDENNDLNSQVSTESSQPRIQKFFLQPGSYEIILCIDSRERYSNNLGNQNRAAFHTALQKRGVKVENRTLPLGDFVWIAREKNKTDLPNSYLSNDNVNLCRELVLDFIIERKRIDDLASSIRDKRWNEQKFRLRNCGLRRPTYLIEYFGKQSRKQDHGFFKASVLDQAISNCEIDGFEIKITENFEETVRYLANMSKWLQRFYADKMIFSCTDKAQLDKTCAGDFHYLTFNEFSVDSSKIQIFTAKEMFIKHLLLIKGLSFGKVQSLIAKYPTIRSLLEEYSNITNEKKRMELLSDIYCDSLLGSNRRLGPAISKKICQFYTTF